MHGNPYLPNGDVTPLRDPAALGWVDEAMSEASFATVGGLLPPVFDAYARIFHPFDRDGEPRRWSEVAAENGRIAHPLMDPSAIATPASSALPPADVRFDHRGSDYPREGELPFATRHALVDVLCGFTEPEAPVLFGVWEGFGTEHTVHTTWVFENAARLTIPGRTYLM